MPARKKAQRPGFEMDTTFEPGQLVYLLDAGEIIPFQIAAANRAFVIYATFQQDKSIRIDEIYVDEAGAEILRGVAESVLVKQDEVRKSVPEENRFSSSTHAKTLDRIPFATRGAAEAAAAAAKLDKALAEVPRCG